MGERSQDLVVYQKSIPYLNILSYCLLSKGLMDLGRNIKMIQNKVNVYNLPNYQQFLANQNEVNAVLSSLRDEEEKFQTYLQEISLLVNQDVTNFRDRIDKTTL